jgi:hypothetical protein
VRRLVLSLLTLALASPAQAADDLAFFESHIRPLLIEKCLDCHSASTKLKGGLSLDHRDTLLRGGDTGPALTPTTQREQSKLLALTGADLALEGRITSFELAFRMQAAMPEAQDIDSETPATQKLYGLDNPVTANFGRQCLMARRFAERGVRFIQVTHSDSEVQWDQHSNLYKVHLHATLLALLGIQHGKLTHRYAGRDFRLTDVSSCIVKELFA